MHESSSQTSSTLRHVKSEVFSTILPTRPRRSHTDVAASHIKTSSTTRLLSTSRAASTPPERPKGTLRGDSNTTLATATTADVQENWLKKSLSRKKSQYYDESFAYREPNCTPKTRLAKDFLVTAEIKLNHCLESEQEFLIDIAFLLSEIYQRPAECIIVLINTDLSMFLNGLSEPAYHISISALASEVAATKNKRAAGLLQEFMFENAHIASERGVFAFNVISEDNIVANGMPGQQSKERHAVKHTLRDRSLDDVTPQRSRKHRGSSTAKPMMYSRRTTTPLLQGNEIREDTACSFHSVEKKKVRQRKSLMALLGF